MSQTTYPERAVVYNVPKKEAVQIRNIERALLHLLSLDFRCYDDIARLFFDCLDNQKIKTYKLTKEPEEGLPVTGKDS